jgi:hypothetical protein
MHETFIMFMTWVIAALTMLMGAYALLGQETLLGQEAIGGTSSPSASAMALATNMSEYRQAVVRFAHANPSYAGGVPASDIAPYMGANVANPVWQSYVLPNTAYTGSLVVIYPSTTVASDVIIAMEQLAQGSALAGVALGANIVSPGNSAVPLPGALANAIPNGAPVWMAQQYD